MNRKLRTLSMMAIYLSIAAVLQGCLPYFSVTRYVFSTYDECDYYRNLHPVEVNIRRIKQPVIDKCYSSKIDNQAFGVTSRNANDYAREVCLLELALIDGRYDVMKILVKNGASIQRCKEGYEKRFFYWALRTQEPEQLLSLFPTLKITQIEKQDFLISICSQYPNSVLFLLELGVDPNYRYMMGDTALHRCIQFGMSNDAISSVKYLLEWGADPKILDTSGKTAFDTAKKRYESTLYWKELTRIFEETKAVHNNAENL